MHNGTPHDEAQAVSPSPTIRPEGPPADWSPLSGPPWPPGTPTPPQWQNPMFAPFASTPPPERRQVGLETVVAIVLIVAVVFGGAGVVAGLAIRGPRTTPAAAGIEPLSSSSPPSSAEPLSDSSSPAGPASIAPADGAALLAKVLPLPGGASAINVTGSTGGIMDLDQYLKKEYANSPSERSRLQARAFLVAAQRNWVDRDGVEVHMQLVQFGADEGAESFVLAQSEALGRDTSYTDNFALSYPHGAGFGRPTLDAGGNRHMVLVAQDGPIAVFIFMFTASALNQSAGSTLMQQQMRALA